MEKLTPEQELRKQLLLYKPKDSIEELNGWVKWVMEGNK